MPALLDVNAGTPMELPQPNLVAPAWCQMPLCSQMETCSSIFPLAGPPELQIGSRQDIWPCLQELSWLESNRNSLPECPCWCLVNKLNTGARNIGWWSCMFNLYFQLFQLTVIKSSTYVLLFCLQSGSTSLASFSSPNNRMKTLPCLTLNCRNKLEGVGGRGWGHLQSQCL